MASQIWGFTSPDSTPASFGLEWWMNLETILVLSFILYYAFRELFLGKLILKKFRKMNSRIQALEEISNNLQWENESLAESMNESFRERDQAELERLSYKELFDKTALATIPKITDVDRSGALVGIYEDAQTRELVPVEIPDEVIKELDKQHDKLVEEILRIADIPKDPE